MNGSTTEAPAGIDAPPAAGTDDFDGETPILVCIPDDPDLWRAVGASYGTFQQMVGPACKPMPGSVAGVCLSCDCKIWIGPKQQQHPTVHTFCLVCGLVLAAQGATIYDIADLGLQDGANLEGGAP